MNVTPIHKEWLEIWSNVPSGTQHHRWFVDYCTPTSKDTVADCLTAADAHDAASLWNLAIRCIQ